MTMRARSRGAAGALLAAASLSFPGCADLASAPERVPERLEVLPADTSIFEGEAVGFQVRALDASGTAFDPIPSWAQTAWSVTDPVAAAIAADGRATGLEAGREARIVAGLAQLSAAARLRVNPLAVRMEAPAVHLTQAVQTLGGRVPLIAGRPALFRLFVTGDRPSFFRPSPQATFYLDADPIHTMRLEPADRLPVEVEEGRGDYSFNGDVPGWALQPGVELAVELDPDGVVPALPGSDQRVPAEGRLPLDVRELPPLHLTVVPILGSGDDQAVLSWVGGMTATGPKLTFLRTILPVGELELTVREPYHTSADLTTEDGWLEALRELDVLRIVEGGRGYYYGALVPPAGSPWGGLGYIGRPTGVGRLDLDTFAHELGHNMGLRHAPCGGASRPDPNFPYADGSIGAFGYEVRGGARRIVGPDEYRDLMTYCDPSWISDYHFEKALDFRADHESLTPADAPREVLLLWGSARGGELLLEPAFVVEAPLKPPRGDGPYLIEGFDAAGRGLFSFRFMPDDLEFGGAQFAFAIPYEARWAGADGLDHIRLSGPEGAVTMPRLGGRRATLVTDPGTGRLRGILRGGSATPAWAAGLEIEVSDGIPTARGPRRRE